MGGNRACKFSVNLRPQGGAGVFCPGLYGQGKYTPPPPCGNKFAEARLPQTVTDRKKKAEMHDAFLATMSFENPLFEASHCL